MLLTTERLKLRRARAEDLTDVNAFMSDPRAMEFWSTSPHRDLEQTRVWLEKMMAAPDDQCEDYLIEMDGRVIGEVGSFPLPEFGFIRHPDYWRRGLSFEAASALIKHIFRTHHVPFLTADADPRNAGSLALLTKLGFKKTGAASATYCIDGVWVDSVYFELRRPSI